MKKINIAFILVFIMAIFVGCSSNNNSKQDNAEVITITIPKTYFEFCRTDAVGAVESLKKLGNQYCTAAEEKDGSVIIQVTDEQRNNLVDRNDESIQELVDDLYKENEKYSYVGDEQYKEISVYFDENASMMTQAKSTVGIASGYALNYMLINETSEWSVNIHIYNCHTNKLVVEGVMPEGKISYNNTEWEKSYKE